MIQYFVNGQEVELSSDLQFDIIRENVLVNKSGDYSLNINIDLRSKQNRAIYDKPLKLSSKFEYQNREATLLANGEVIMKGTEVVLAIEERTAVVQILSNNSAVKFFFDDSISIRKLNLGTVETLNPTDAARVTNAAFTPGVDEAYPVVIRRDVGVNNIIYGAPPLYNYSQTRTDVVFDDNTTLMPQPYLLSIIKKVCNAIGYTITTNSIDTVKNRHLIIVQNYHMTEYAKMLPDWTIKEFISEVEKFFNVIFRFNTINKTVEIISVKSFYESTNPYLINRNKVLDMFSVNLDKQEDAFQTSYDNVGYKLPSDNYWRMANIDKNTMASANIEPASWGYQGQDGDEYLRTIFYDAEKDVFFIRRKTDNGFIPHLVNDFIDHNVSDKVGKSELGIRPAKIAYHYYVSDYGSQNFAAPSVFDKDQTEQTFEEVIIEGDKEYIPEDIQVAIFLGNIQDRGGAYKVCQSQTTYLNDFPAGLAHFPTEEIDGFDETWTLSIRGKNGRYLKEFVNDVHLDTSKIFHIKFIASGPLLDPKNKFILGDESFYCKQLKYTVTDCKLGKIVEGEFFKEMQFIDSWGVFIKQSDLISDKNLEVEYDGTGHYVNCADWQEIKTQFESTIKVIAKQKTGFSLKGWEITYPNGMVIIHPGHTSALDNYILLFEKEDGAYIQPIYIKN